MQLLFQKELRPKAAQIPRVTKEARLLSGADAFPFFLNLASAFPLLHTPIMTNQKAGTAYFIFFAYAYVAGERFSELV